jgi:LasA protease
MLPVPRLWRLIARRRFTPPGLFLFVLLLAALSCNAPSRRFQSSSGFTAEDLRQTVEAMPAPATKTPAANLTPGAISPELDLPIRQAPPAGGFYRYVTRPGDTVAGLAGRFDAQPDEIIADVSLSEGDYVASGLSLSIPDRLEDLSPAQPLLPDAELVYSPTALDFDLPAYVTQGAGFLAVYREELEDEIEFTGAQIVQRVSDELSVNPRLLLAILEYRSGWVFASPPGAALERYPLGFRIAGHEGLYQELRIAATQLNLAYYGWRAGSFQTIHFEDGVTLRLDPRLNAGTVAVMHLFSLFSDWQEWADDLYAADGFPTRYGSLFGDMWTRASAAGPLIPSAIVQPGLVLPFRPGEAWSLTAGPHNAWNAGTPLGALDFSPITGEEPCAVSTRWVTASAPGVVARAADHAVALDLDGDGFEGTGWVIVYFHLAKSGMIQQGTRVSTDDPLGHPSCQGGQASGTHVHVARKYNGEWLAADGPVPFVLSGWRAVAGERIYQGQLQRGAEVVTADSAGRSGSTVIR